MAEFRHPIVDMTASGLNVYHGLDVPLTDQPTGLGGNYFVGQLFANMQMIRVDRTVASDNSFGVTLCTFDPHWLLDYRIGHPGWVARVRSLVILDHLVDDADYFFGVGGWKPTAAVRTQLYGIGFKCTNGGNWFAYLVDGSTSHKNADTSQSSSVVRELMVEIDGRDATVRWYIDGTLVDSFAFTSPTALGELNNGSQDPGWPTVGFQLYNVGLGGGQARGYFLAGHRDPILEFQTGVPDGDPGPDKPVETLVLAGATFADVAGSAYATSTGLGHFLSQWEITLATDTTFSSPVQSFVSNAFLTEFRHTGLSPSTNYIARVRYVDAGLGISLWSDAIAVNTVATDPQTGWAPCAT